MRRLGDDIAARARQRARALGKRSEKQLVDGQPWTWILSHNDGLKKEFFSTKTVDTSNPVGGTGGRLRVKSISTKKYTWVRQNVHQNKYF